MATPFILSQKISTGNRVTKYEFKSSEGIISQGLHFIPGDKISSILNHSHTKDSEKYYRLKIKKTKNDQITSMKWEPLPAVSASTPDQNSHSVESSDEMQIIFGVERSKECTEENWPQDILPKVSYSHKDGGYFRFILGDETIYIDSNFKRITSKENAAQYIYSDSDNSEENVNYERINTESPINILEFNNSFNRETYSPKKIKKRSHNREETR